MLSFLWLECLIVGLTGWSYWCILTDTAFPVEAETLSSPNLGNFKGKALWNDDLYSCRLSLVWCMCAYACIISFSPCVLAMAALHSGQMFHYYFQHQEKVAGNEMEQACKAGLPPPKSTSDYC